MLIATLVVALAGCSSTYRSGATSSGTAAAAAASTAPSQSCNLQAATPFIANGKLHGIASVSCNGALKAYQLVVILQIQDGAVWKDVGDPTTTGNLPTTTAHGFMADAPCALGKGQTSLTVRVDASATETREGGTSHYNADTADPLTVNQGDC